MEFKRSTKKRTILYLLESFLLENGYKQTAECLRSEGKLTEEYTVCDNINLETIVTEFEIFYQQRFKIYPQICKRVTPVSIKSKISNHSTSSINETGANFEKITSERSFKLKDQSNKDKAISTSCLMISNFSKKGTIPEETKTEESQPEFELIHEEWKEYKNIIMQNMCYLKNQVRWSDIKGLNDVKELLKEAIIYPIKYPELFTEIIEPWRSILMYGPPGTGKTLLAQALATESGAKFFNISSSTIINKWRGDTEKLIKVLFQLAHHYAPSIIFMDEIDSLTLKRNPYEHEASRRMKSELFFGVDSLINSKDNVFLLATTNVPWDLDEAMLRRFEKQVYIPVPDKETRRILFENFLPKIIHENPLIKTEIDYNRIAEISKYLSGCDIKNTCKEVKIKFMREIFKNLEFHDKKNFNLKIKVISNQDVETTLNQFRPSVIYSEYKYTNWKTEYNCNGLKNEKY